MKRALSLRESDRRPAEARRARAGLARSSSTGFRNGEDARAVLELVTFLQLQRAAFAGAALAAAGARSSFVSFRVQHTAAGDRARRSA
jgi:hypothetical protein